MRFKNYPLLLLCLPFLFSCRAYRYVYSPPAANVCYFKEKGDSKVGAYYYEGGSGNHGNTVNIKSSGYDFQGGYAFSNKWGITASYSHRSERDTSYDNYEEFKNNSLVQYKRNQFEIGVANFKLNKNNNSTTNICFGFGAGNYKINEQGTTDSFTKYTRDITMPFVKFYIQPSFNYVANTAFRFAASLKANIFHYGNSSGNYTEAEQNYWGFDQIKNRLVIYVEPNLNIQAGIPEHNWIRFEMNLSVLLFDLNFPSQTLLQKRGAGVSFGLTFDPGAAFRKSGSK